MNNWILKTTLVSLLLMGNLVHAKPIPAELVLGQGRAWKGQIVLRDGDWIEFSRGTAAQPIRIGVSSIKELNFDVNINAEQVLELMDNREFDQVIGLLKRTLDPFSEYSDIPSNLTPYSALLMEIYYHAKQYDKSLALSEKIATDSRSPALQNKARVYRALALIDSGRQDEAKALMREYKWDRESTEDNAPEILYIKAKLLALNGEYRKAMNIVAKVIVFHSQDPDWIQPAEMLCAEIYTELGMYDSAEEVCRQILILYQNTPEYDQAKQLKDRIAKLRAEAQ